MADGDYIKNYAVTANKEAKPSNVAPTDLTSLTNLEANQIIGLGIDLKNLEHGYKLGQDVSPTASPKHQRPYYAAPADDVTSEVSKTFPYIDMTDSITVGGDVFYKTKFASAANIRSYMGIASGTEEIAVVNLVGGVAKDYTFVNAYGSATSYGIFKTAYSVDTDGFYMDVNVKYKPDILKVTLLADFDCVCILFIKKIN